MCGLGRSEMLVMEREMGVCIGRVVKEKVGERE